MSRLVFYIRNSAIAVLLLAAYPLLFFSGCQKVDSSQGEWLSFDSPRYNAGPVRGQFVGTRPIQHEFRFKVCGPVPIQIVDVRSSCRCMAAINDKDTQKLNPGDENTLTLELDPAGQIGMVKGQAQVITEPPSPRPIVLSMSAVVMVEPLVVPNPVIIRKTQREPAHDVTLKVVYLRTPQEAALCLDKDATDLGPFSIREERYSHEQRVVGRFAERLPVDLLALRLKPRGKMSVGTHNYTVRLAWKNLKTSSNVPVSVTIEPLLSLSVSSVFWGVVRPNERIEKTIPFDRCDISSAAKIKIESDLDYLQASVDRSGGQLRLTLQAPSKAGRFKGIVRIYFPSENGQAGQNDLIELPVSGIVEAEAS